MISQLESNAIKWLKNEIEGIPNFINSKEINESFTVDGLKAPPLCDLVLFRYDATIGNSFGYWDKYPIVLIVRPLPNHFFGFNMHYLDKDMRTKILDVIYNIQNNEGTRITKFKKIYGFLDALVKVGTLGHAYKNYNYSSMTSKFIIINKDYYKLIANLPIATLKENKGEK